jgi:hypothetical protein
MKIFWVIMVTIMINACKSINLDTDACDEIKEILIINRGANKFIMDSTKLTDSNSFKEFCVLHTEMKLYDNHPNVKSNFGFFEIIITTNDNDKMNMRVIYTVYEGVVIRDFNGDFYKQDKFDDYIIQKSNKKQ